MKASALKTTALFYITSAGFVVMALVGWPLFNNAMKGKEKDFYDKLFYTAFAYQQQCADDTALMNAMTSDSAAVSIIQTKVKKGLDSVFYLNEIPADYVYAIGISSAAAKSDFYVKNTELNWGNKNLLWSSNHAYDSLLIKTKARIANLGPAGRHNYYVKIWFPSKFVYFFRALLPLIGLAVFTLLMLFFCFIILISIIKKQNRLAQIKNDFVNNMTHELKTPLFTISIAAKMLAEQETIKNDKKQSSYVHSIQQETLRLSGLVENVLQSSVAEKKQTAQGDAALDLHQSIRAAVERFDLVQAAQQAKIECSLIAPRSKVPGNEADIETAMVSLIDNAVKYSNPPAQIAIATKNTGGRIEVAVTDRGIGIDETTKPFIFDRFYRAGTGNLHAVKGYGIGLSQVKTIVEAHGGSVTVNSTVGKGSEFIISLPCIYDDNANTAAAG